MNNIQIPQFVHQTPKVTLPNYAKELTTEVLSEYRHLKATLKPDQSINLVCSVGLSEYDVYSVGVHGNFVWVATRVEDTVRRILAPIEQISFAIVLSEKKSEVPPREIGELGFDGIRKYREKMDAAQG